MRIAVEKLRLGAGIGLDTGEAVRVEDGYRGSALNVAVVDADGTFVVEYAATDGDVSFAGVNGVVLDDAGRIYAVDDGNNNFFWVLDSAGGVLARLGPEIAGHGSIGPAHLALGPDGKVYIADTNTSRVVVLQLEPPLWPPP